jgi:site-specific DNA-methyltransferase (adenine-specific)
MQEIRHGDCLAVMREMPDASVDAVVTDPPYGLAFMGKRWDYDVPSVEVWAECLRVLKPGGHLLAFAGTRTQHRMAVRIEDAGFEIRDMIAWVYGSGFPKSLDVSKAIDKAAGAEREKVPGPKTGGMASLNKGNAAQGYRDSAYYDEGNMIPSSEPVTDDAKRWEGWGTALKPALEPITVARKPLIGTVAENVLAHGTGALNVDGCRVEGAPPSVPQPVFNSPTGRTYGMKTGEGRNGEMSQAAGRWPANLIHDGSEEVVGLFPETKGGQPMNRMHTDPGRHVASGASRGGIYMHTGFGDSGSAARFFYCAKASKRDRDEGCDGLALVTHQSGMGGAMPVDDDGNARDRFKAQSRNHHPTVKPTALMQYLCRLVTPPGGTVLDPFAGSGSTGKAAALEGFRFIGIEREAEYVEIARARIAAAVARAGLFERTAS